MSETNRHQIPQELKSQVQIWNMIYLQDFVFIIAFFMISSIFKSFVHDYLRNFYLIFNFFVAVILTSPSPFNKQKKIYHSIFYLIIKDTSVYHFISNKKENENECIR